MFEVHTALESGSTLSTSTGLLDTGRIQDAFNKFADMSEVGDNAIEALKEVRVAHH